MELSNRTVLITGGTDGIGFGLAEAFYRSKSKVIVCGRDKEKLIAVEKKFPEFTVIPCDIADVKQRESLAANVLQRFPDLDILVNNAGVQRYIDLKSGYDAIKLGEDEITINFVAVVELTALFIGHLLKKQSAAVINVSSALALMPTVNTPIYNATKAAIHAYTLTLRQQLKGTSVKAIEVLPPWVDTNLNRQGRGRSSRSGYRGLSVPEYIPSVMQGLENDVEMIFHGDGAKIMSEPRSESETRLLSPSW
jgi:uncharacterized oxidoreductase